MEEIRLVSSPMQPHLKRLIENCHTSLVIASPYIKRSAIEWLISAKSTSLSKISILTNISLNSVLSSGLEIAALRLIFESFQTVTIVSLSNLHAKIFIADESIALITSANLTNGGLWTNYEYGVVVSEQTQIKTILSDIYSYMKLGSVVSPEFLDIIESQVIEIIEKQAIIESSLPEKNLHQELRQSEQNLQDAFLENRLQRGQTLNRLFSDTILYLLKRSPEGLTTQQIHGEIQDIHPDICDDSIDRVINGQHFGKEWKHHVRAAQEFLKNKNMILAQMKSGK